MALLQEFDYFFDLPGELRKQILCYLLVKPGGIVLGPVPSIDSGKSENETGFESVNRQATKSLIASLHTHDYYDDEQPHAGDDLPWPLPYFLVSQTFYHEATAVFFRENIFYLSPTSGGRNKDINACLQPRNSKRIRDITFFSTRKAEDLLTRPEWMQSRRRIRHLVLYVHSRRGSFQKEVYAPLMDMILAGALRELEVRVTWPVTARIQGGSGGVLETAPMQAMYRVLNDPDLHTARLRVAVCEGKMLHDGAWCRFHQNDEAGLGLGSCGVKHGVSDGWRGEWIEVDVKGVIKTHGGLVEQMKILKVG